MAEFGWAYVGDGNGVTDVPGPSGSVLLKRDQQRLTGSSALIFNTGSNVLEVDGDVSASANISASYFYGDGSNLTGISHPDRSLDDVLTVGNTSTLSMSVNSVTSSTANFSGLASGTGANASSYLALDSNNNVILTSSAGGGEATGVIGEAEDGDYTDGLYTDFTPTTPIGTAIDRFNEILKIISPPITPKVQSIDYDQSNGISAKLSFDDSNPITDYTASSTEGGFTAIPRNGIYEADTADSNFKLGIYNGQTFTGTVNYDVTLNEINSNVVYTADAFGQANNGTLKLELNGTVIHSVDLSSFTGAGDPGSGTADSLTSNSGFIDVSVSASSYDGNGSEWVQYQYRTAKYQIDSGDQNKGWNYLRVIHTIGSTDYASNYIEWVNDPDGAAQALSISNERVEDIVTNGSIYLSGVEYNTQITASYKAEINNIYRNVFPTGTPISFSTTRATQPSAQSVPDLGLGEDETKVLPITASFNLQGVLYPSQTIGLGINVTHPLKANLNNSGVATATGFLIFDNTPPVSSNTTETFIDEARRLVSGSYDTQGSVTDQAAGWSSLVDMTEQGAGDHANGLLQIGTSEFSGRLYSPRDADLPNSGDFSALANGESGNPNYSSVTGTRTWFRKIQNTNTYDVYNMLISTTKSATLFNNSALGTGNLNAYIKVPGTTGWMDISQAFSYGNTSDGDGALISTAANDTDSGNNTHYITFGTLNVSANDYVVIKFVGDASWAGYIAQMSFTLPANQNQATPQTLSDINGDVTGIAANLSFGSSNSIPDYTNVTPSGIPLDTFDSNDLYNITDNRRGIFSASVDIEGTINDAIGGGSGYPDDAFFDGYVGDLILEINGTEVHSVDLDQDLALISSTNANGSGFNLSGVSFSTLSGIPHYTKPYRTGTYNIDSSEQREGWNYARIIHRIPGSGDQTTNYIEWVVDPSGSVDDLSVTNTAMTDFNHTDVYYQSGIGYFASSPTASYTCVANNFYRNVYSDDNDAVRMYQITNLAVSNIRVSGSGIITTSSAPVSNNGIPMAVLNNTNDCEEQSFQMTGSLTYSRLDNSISGGLGLFTAYDVLARSEIKHPFKNGGYARGASETKTSFMVFSGSNTSNENINEYFTSEDYRIVSGNYANQAAVTSSANTWDSTVSMNDTLSYVEHSDGLVTINGYAISPLQIGNAGDTRNDSEGSTGLQAPAGNPNYSDAGLAESERTFYRYFRNTSGVLVTSPSITLFGDATIIAADGTVGANNNIKVELKVPSDPTYTGNNDKSTGWCDVGSPLDDQQDLTVDGAGLYTGTLDSNVDGDGAQVNLGFQSKGIYNNQYFVVKITAHKDWTGYLSEIRMAY
jgi:hypothetical protein